MRIILRLEADQPGNFALRMNNPTQARLIKDNLRLSGDWFYGAGAVGNSNLAYSGKNRLSGYALLLASGVSAGVLLTGLFFAGSARAEGVDISQGVGTPQSQLDGHGYPNPDSSGYPDPDSSGYPDPDNSGYPLSDVLSGASQQNDDIYLNAEVNGQMRSDMFAFRQNAAGDFLVKKNELKNIGIIAEKQAVDKNSYVNLSQLKNVKSAYDAGKQAIIFTTLTDKALAPYTVSLDPWAAKAREEDDMEGKPRADLAAVVNYSIYASSDSERKFQKAFDFNGVSANLDGRLTGWFGSINSGQLLTYNDGSDHSDYRTVRLDSYWSYSDPKRMMTYRAGDLVTRSLPWSRSVHLGGIQIRRNFGIRPDLVTMPMPNFSGSAAVPSAVDLYINNAKRATQNVPVGPFNLTDLPVVTGNNEAKLVVRDAQGRETTTKVSFFGSSELLAKGLWDFSFEAGLPRRNYGASSGDYDGHFFATGTTRYGLTNNITVEGHGEVGESFVNGGAGTIFTLWDIGTLSLAGSGSSYKGKGGGQYSAGFQAQKWGFSLSARTQGASRQYSDIVSASADKKSYYYDDSYYRGGGDVQNNYDEYTSPDQKKKRKKQYYNSSAQKMMNQVSLSVPLFFDPTSITFSYTESKNWGSSQSRYAGISASRGFGRRVYAYVNGFKDLKDSKSYSIFAGMTVTLSDKYSASVDTNTDHSGTNVSTSLSRQMGSNIGDYGWTLRDIEGDQTQRGASGNYRTSIATFSGSVDQVDHRYRATADMTGALVIADNSIMPSNQIYDSFAVVNAGAPGVKISSQNVYYGKTGWNGRLVVPNLTSFRENRLSIDVESLPLDTLVTETDAIVTPAYQSGIVQHFDVSGASDYIYASLQDSSGKAIPTGSYAVIDGGKQGFDIAYDGMGIVPTKGVSFPLNLTVYLPDDKACRAVINKPDDAGLSGGAVPVLCTPIAGTVTPPKALGGSGV